MSFTDMIDYRLGLIEFGNTEKYADVCLVT